MNHIDRECLLCLEVIARGFICLTCRQYNPDSDFKLKKGFIVKTKKRNKKKERTQTDWEEEVDWRR